MPLRTRPPTDLVLAVADTAIDEASVPVRALLHATMKAADAAATSPKPSAPSPDGPPRASATGWRGSPRTGHRLTGGPADQHHDNLHDSDAFAEGS